MPYAPPKKLFASFLACKKLWRCTHPELRKEGDYDRL